MKNAFDSLKFCVSLKVWRKMHSLSAHEVAQLVSMPPSTYAFTESAERTPTIAEFSRLCQLMEFDAAEFFKMPEKAK